MRGRWPAVPRGSPPVAPAEHEEPVPAGAGCAALFVYSVVDHRVAL